MGEISKAVGQWIVANVGWSVIIILFILSGLFKITKVELNPIGWLAGWIGKFFTQDIQKDIASLKEETNRRFDEIETKQEEISSSFGKNDEELSKRLKEIEERQDKMTAARIKNHVLTFSRRCRNGEKHTIEDFRNLIEENEEYEVLVSKYNWKNDVYTEDFAYFMEEYRRCIRENDFLGVN